MRQFDSHGVRFRYPDDWTLTHEHQGSSLVVNLQTPGTAFWSLTLLADCPDVNEVLEAAIAAFEEEYENVDVYVQETSLEELPTAACDLDFVCLDLVNSASIRSILLGDCTALVMYQAESREFEDLQADFDAVMSSLEYVIEDGGEHACG